jgi:hypothetical protein
VSVAGLEFDPPLNAWERQLVRDLIDGMRRAAADKSRERAPFLEDSSLKHQRKAEKGR